MDKYVITISRGYGSGGRTLGKMLAKELGVNCYDREILKLASEDSGISEQLFAEADEKLKGTLLFKIAKDLYTGEVIPPESEDFVSNKNLFNYQAKVMKALADNESCVIIGRGADYVLKGYPNVVRLYVHAPLEDCVIRLQNMMDLSDKEARKKIAKIDKYRAEYYKYYTGKEWNDAQNYDLCINTSEFELEKCIEVVKAYMKIKFGN